VRRQRRAADDDEAFDRRATPRPWWWRMLLRRPLDTVAFLAAAAAASAIIVNSAYLQHGPHPAPMFAVKPLPVAASEPAEVVGMLPRPRPVAPEAAKHEVVLPRPRPEIAENPKARSAVAPRKDQIAELLAAHPVQPVAQPLAQPTAQPAPQAAYQPPAPPSRSLAQPSRQVLAVQRVLSEFAYGQLKPTGVNDADTRLAIQRFERDHKMPITGEVSDRLVRELVALTGHELD
jgi:hypothetical protein